MLGQLLLNQLQFQHHAPGSQILSKTLVRKLKRGFAALDEMSQNAEPLNLCKVFGYSQSSLVGS